MFDLNSQTVGFDTENNALVIIDQTKLPNEKVVLNLKTKEEIFDAIKDLKLRGAPCIGVSAAIAMAVLSNDSKAQDFESFEKEFEDNYNYLLSARPTAVNLLWALNEMKFTLESNSGKNIDEIKKRLTDKALEITEKEIATCKAIGEYGAELLKDKDSILTHCNAGRLACVKYGTALAPVYVAKEQGHSINVYADETRPLLQGARLTAYELTEAGIDTTVICDNMASHVMKNGLVDAVLVGADRIAQNGDTANKIGTSALAILAKHYDIPFYVCAPFSSVDLECTSGKDIPIEMRDGSEIAEMWYKDKMIPEAADTLNPAFDVTDSKLITAFITDKGVIKPKDLADFKKKKKSRLEKIALPDYSRKEDWLNSISHMVGGGLSILAILLCFYRAYQARSWEFAAVGFLYGFCMLAMYSCSSVYHALRPNNGKRAMRKVDHAMIFPMIAGTITPYALFVIMPQNFALGIAILIVAWVVVAAAIPLTIVIFNQTKAVQMVLYLVLGWMIIICIRILWNSFDRTGFWLLVAGGIAYTVGAIIYGIGAKKKYFHSVFHFFVLIASILHFLSLFFFVFVK